MTTTYFSLASGDFLQDWSNIGLIATSDNWDGVASIVGYRGDNITAGTGIDPQTLTADDSGRVIDVNANQTAPNSFATGGVSEFHLADPTIALAGSSTADAPYLALFMDATGRKDVTLSFRVRDLENGADDAIQQVAVQYRIGDSGAWTNLPEAYVADATAGSAFANDRQVSVTLPDVTDGQAAIQLRIMTTNAIGNDEWVGIDDIRVASTAMSAPPQLLPGALSVGDVSRAEGNSGTSDFLFTVTRSGGDDGAVSATWTVALTGSADAADFAGPLSGTVSFADGETEKTIAIQVRGDTGFEPTEGFNLVLSGPTGGATILDGEGAGTIVNDDAGPLANVWFNEFHYDNVGTDAGEFVEIAGLAGTDLSGWSIEFYRGAGTVYATKALSGVIADQGQGFGTLSIAQAGLQNGTSGFALVDSSGRVVQFLSYEGVVTATAGAAAGLTSTDVGVAEDPAPVAGVSLQLQGQGSSYGDFSWGTGLAQNPGAANAGQSFLSGSDEGQIRIGDARIVEGSGGETMLSFTVTRAGGFDGTASVGWTLGFGSADLADLVSGTTTAGTVTFGANEFVKTIRIAIDPDLVGERNETLVVTLSDVVGHAVITDGVALGTIVNDDPIALTIMQIQGEGHRSDYAGQPVITRGIVTAVDSNGFFLQDATGDGNARTSDALFVYTGTAPTVRIGDSLEVTASVSEFASSTGLSVTELVPSRIDVLAQGVALPEAVLIGEHGVLPPSQAIDSDGLTIFNPDVDGIDFWESLEGMRVTIETPQAVANSNQYGETDVVASAGVGAIGMNARGGITIAAGDYNPEKIQIDDRLIGGAGGKGALSQGDLLSSVTGVLHYSHERYELVATEGYAVSRDVTLTEEATALRGDANFLTLATYNVENLDVSDNKFDLLANDIVYSLGAPDIVALQEVQDADGAGGGADLSGTVTAQGLIDAIYAASGIRYSYIEIAPTVAGSTGGEPGGNIRSGYLYQADRVSYVAGSAELLTDSAFNGSRKPLVATWSFDGQQVTTINIHFTSRLGSDSLWGATQPPADGGDSARTAQAGAVLAWANAHLADDPAMNIAVLGDWNGFYFERAQTQMTEGGVFTNLAQALLTPEERYSYVFDGNAQLIDNILVTGGLLPGASIDGVHINAEFTAVGRPTDHDPQVARLLLGGAPRDIVIDDATIAENMGPGSLVGMVGATDRAGDVLRYTLVDDAGGAFAIDGASGALTATRAFDFETEAGFAIRVRVTDSAGQWVERDLSIVVGNVNEAPVAADDRAAVVEDGASANLWSVLLANDRDVDAGDQLTIASVNTAGTLGSVQFDAASQSLVYVADGDAFDWLAPGATMVDQFRYTVVDAGGLAHEAVVEMTVTGAADGLRLRGGNGIDMMAGGSGEDIVTGGNGNDRLSGGAGHDLLSGENGDDVLSGDAGRDILFGGRGNDQLWGGAGDDWFVFGKSSGSDTVFDYGAGDRIALIEGVTLASSRVMDVDGDQRADLVLSLGGGGTVTLMGVASLGEVAFGTLPSLPDNGLEFDWVGSSLLGAGGQGLAAHNHVALV